MGAGFWVIQVILVVAAIAIGVSAERRNRAEQNSPPVDAPRRRILVESASVSRGVPQFTAREHSRLVMLRRLVEQARALKNDLYDDLQADASTDPDSTCRSRSWRTVAVCLGVGLVVVGSLGVWQMNAAMAGLERESTDPVGSGSIVSHLVPGVVANPGRYLDAVNSSVGSVTSDRESLEAAVWIDQKEAVDRFEAVIGAGIACLLAAVSGWPRPSRDGQPTSSIGSDLLPFVLVASVFLIAISFFELV